jgi:hypothetical protein
MKAEHRHQLQTNVLADHMGRLLQSVKSGPKSTSVATWVLIGLAVATVGIWRYWASAAQARESTLWTEVDTATHDPQSGPPQLDKIGDENLGTLPGRTAVFQLARLRFQRGQENVYTYRSYQAIESIKQALQDYTKVAPNCPDAPLLEQEALMGIGKAKETLIGVTSDKPQDDYGTVDQALEAYRKLVKRFPESDLAKEAEARIDELETKGPEVEEFYKQLNRSASKPKPEPAIPEELK